MKRRYVRLRLESIAFFLLEANSWIQWNLNIRKALQGKKTLKGLGST